MLRDKNKSYTRYIVVSILFVVTFFLMLFNISELTLGKGLGREVVVLTNDIASDYKYNFDRFKKYIRENKIEYTYAHTDSDNVLVEFSGVEDVERFTEDLSKQFPGLLIYELGTFNSISSITKTSNTIQSYFVVFFIAFVTIWTYRYRLLGLYGSMMSVFNVLLALNFTNSFGFLFDYKVWFTVLILFITLVLLKGWTIYKANRNYDAFKIKKAYLMSILFLLNASVFLFLLDPLFHGSSALIGFAALILGVELFILKFGLNKYEEIFLKNKRFKPYVEKRSGIKMPDMINDRVLVFLMTIFIVVVSVISLIGFYQTEKHTPVFSQENYLIVDNNDAITFLEVQASVGKYDLTKNLIEYKISEEKKTWYVFDEYTNWQNLNKVKQSIEEKLDVETSVVKKDGLTLRFKPQAQLLFFVGFMLVNFLILYVLYNKEFAVYFLFINAVFFGFLYVFKVSFNLRESLQFITLTLLIPVINALSLNFLNKEENILRSVSIAGVLGYVFTILGLLVLPIILFIPDLSNEHLNMMYLFIVFTITYVSSLFVLSCVMKRRGDVA